MKSLFKHCVLLLVFAAPFEVVAQTSGAPVLVDEFETISCEDFRSRIDSLLTELSYYQPGWSGVVVNRGEKRTQLVREYRIKSYVAYRQFDAKRILYVRTTPDGTFKTELWRVPAGKSVQIAPEEIDSGYVLSQQKPMMLFTDSAYDEVECGPADLSGLFALVLQGNPKARANIVIRYRTLRQSRIERARLINVLVGSYGIEPSRIRTFLKTQPRSYAKHDVSVEYWYLP